MARSRSVYRVSVGYDDYTVWLFGKECATLHEAEQLVKTLESRMKQWEILHIVIWKQVKVIGPKKGLR